jgi:phenylacetate-CoA ligase
MGGDGAAAPLAKLNALLAEVIGRNPFYTRKWRAAGLKETAVASVEALRRLPFTTRAELLADQRAQPPLGTNLTCRPEDYRHFFRSSGTTHAPICWADTEESWRWVTHCSQALHELAGVQPGERVLFALDFGMSSGPWIMLEGARRLGCACLAASGVEPSEQLRWVQAFHPTVVVAKTGHFLELARTAEAAGLKPATLGVKKLICTGAPSVCQAAVRAPIEEAWAGACFDRYGLTEAGSVACECPAHPGGLHLLETDFIAEVVHPHTRAPVDDGDEGELVLTTLGRTARPVIRYLTGDAVRLRRAHSCACGRHGALLLGGVRRAPGSSAPPAG